MLKGRNQSVNKGFSLVEVVLAIALLAIIAVPIAQVVYSSLALNKTSRKQMTANDCGQMIMEYVTSQSYKELAPILTGTEQVDIATIPYKYKPANGATLTGFDPATMTYIDAEKIYMAQCTSATTPCKIIYNSSYPDVFVLENVQYGGYHYNVGLRFDPIKSDSDATKNKYFIYKVNIDVFQCDASDHTVLLNDSNPVASFEGSIFNEFN